ncbi:MAG: hypothetical protein K1X31_10545 [Gemmatimonadaceae bacterium]|nr:hypothetical protein [Gemmatimonadaceae bacterium]
MSAAHGAACADCGARYAHADDSCTVRFDTLLALDHSHREPWGSRHGLAFAVFALQHPSRYDARTQARSHELLSRVLVAQEPLDAVVRDFRARDRRTRRAPVALAAPAAAPRRYAVTIADLDDFGADRYPADLDRWGRATLDALGPLPHDPDLT